MREMLDLGVVPLRRRNGRGGLAPHLSLQFGAHLFSIDTSRSPKGSIQPEAYLITHAHSDHNGRSAMLSPLAIASHETARALEIRHGRRFNGRTFHVGEEIDVCGVAIKTHPTGHTIGSCAFSWETDVGSRVVVTGDLKEYASLPRADLLVAEANYGDPWDPDCCFEDDLGRFWEALQEGATFGAYAFGKAQRAVALMRGMGYAEAIGMDPQSLALTKELLPKAGPLVDVSEWGAGPSVVAPSILPQMVGPKYILTGRRDGRYNRIMISDHLDFRGLMRMFEHVSPEAAIVYHPQGPRSGLLASHLSQLGLPALSLDQIRNVFR
ncbi:MAG: hypothetical protein JW986_08965 [Methanotrichaceae archaeon]|nr:hypothetical protein [Methanotrichaceae archaeon]